MTRKLIPLLLTLLLLALPALAEEADPALPTVEDLLGRWDVVYIVTDGVGQPREPGVSYIVITEEVATFCNATSIYAEYTYQLDGDQLKVGELNEVFQWLGDGVLLYRNHDNPTEIGVLHRTTTADNPFLGDWEFVQFYKDGQPAEPNATLLTFTDAFVYWDMADRDEQVFHTAIYDKDGGCRFGTQYAVIDPSGAMIVTGAGEVAVLLPIVY